MDYKYEELLHEPDMKASGNEEAYIGEDPLSSKPLVYKGVLYRLERKPDNSTLNLSDCT